MLLDLISTTRLFLVAAVLVASSGVAGADTWRGTAPFCAGECLPNEVSKGRSNCGDGACCLTGSKVLCGNSSPSCQAAGTKAVCYGVVMICENGYNRPPDGAWIACNSYACGACLGFGETGNISILSQGGTRAGYTTGVCTSGFVWREAVPGDIVCVEPHVREQAREDNAAAAGRRAPAGGPYGPTTCISGFVWREAVPGDHVCVTPEVRSRTRRENEVAADRRVQTPVSYSPVVCKQGYVWREAVLNDHVCVTPQTRSQAAADNAAAASRRSGSGAYGPDTCREGFVWREVVPTDRICVTPDVRNAVIQDNSLARQRRL